jgi:hypothetical protein
MDLSIDWPATTVILIAALCVAFFAATAITLVRVCIWLAAPSRKIKAHGAACESSAKATPGKAVS